MFVSRRKYNDLQARHQRAVDQRDEARTDAATNLSAAVRVAERNTELSRRLDTARGAAGVDTDYAHALESRLGRVLRACARYRAELADERAVLAKTMDNFEIFAESVEDASTDRREERRARRLAEQAHRSLDEQIRPLQAANEAMAAELRDHAEQTGGGA